MPVPGMGGVVLVPGLLGGGAGYADHRIVSSCGRVCGPAGSRGSGGGLVFRFWEHWNGTPGRLSNCPWTPLTVVSIPESVQIHSDLAERQKTCLLRFRTDTWKWSISTQDDASPCLHMSTRHRDLADGRAYQREYVTISVCHSP